MRRASFHIAGFLMAVLLTVLVAGAAFASVTLPGGLTAIEAEAFMGDRAMTGLVRIPAGVNTVREDAFTDTGVFAMELPATVRTVEAQRLSGLTYMRIESRSADLVSLPDTLKYIASPKGGLVQYYANFHHVDFYPVDTLIADGGFYYVPNDTGLTLLSAVDNSAVPASVTIPENVDGQWVNAVSAYAFAGCPQVTSIALPVASEGHVPASATADCSGARVSYYGNGPLVIKSVKASNEEPLVGEAVTFTVEVEGGTGPYTVEYKVFDKGIQENIDSGNIEGTSFTYKFSEIGNYIIFVTIRDSQVSSSDSRIEMTVYSDEFDFSIPEAIEAGKDLPIQLHPVANADGYHVIVREKSTGKIVTEMTPTVKLYYTDDTYDVTKLSVDGFMLSASKTYTVTGYAYGEAFSTIKPIQREVTVTGKKPAAPIPDSDEFTLTNIDNHVTIPFSNSELFQGVFCMTNGDTNTIVYWYDFSDREINYGAYQDTVVQFTMKINGMWTEWTEPITITYQQIEKPQPPFIAIVEEEIRAGEPITIIIGETEGATTYNIVITDTNERYSSRIYYSTKYRAGTYVLDKIAPSLHAGPFRLSAEAFVNGSWTSQNVVDFVVKDQKRPQKPTARFQGLGEATPTDLTTLELIEKNKEFIADDPFMITIDKGQEGIDSILMNYTYSDDLTNEFSGTTKTLKTVSEEQIIQNEQHFDSSWANHSIPYRVAVSKNGVWSEWSEIIRANLIEKPKWEKQITLLSKRQFKNGENIEISFEPVENADYYRLQLNGGDGVPFSYLYYDRTYETKFELEGYMLDSVRNYYLYIAAHNPILNQECELSIPITLVGDKPKPSKLNTILNKTSGMRGETLQLNIETSNAEKIAINTMSNGQIQHSYFSKGIDRYTDVIKTTGDNTECRVNIPLDWKESIIQYSISVYENGLWTEWSEPITITIVDE